MEIGAVERELSQEPISAAYLVCGSDAAARERALRVLKSRLCDPETVEWGLVSVDGSESTGGEVLDLVSTPPFVGDRRVVVVRAANRLEDDVALLPYLENPPDFSTLILVAAQVDKRRKFVQAVRRHGRVLEFETPGANQLAGRVKELALSLGVELDAGTISTVIARAGENMERIEREVEKLAAFAGNGGKVRVAEAERLVAEGLPNLGQYAIFDFVDSLAEGRGADALTRLDKLLSAGEPPLVVLSMVARQFRLLFGAVAWRGERPESLARALELKSSFPAKKALAQEPRWTADEVTEALALCAECDRAMKSGVDGRRALEVLTIKLVTGERARI